MKIESKFDKFDTIYVVVNNHIAMAKVLDVEFKEGEFYYNFVAEDYLGMKTDFHTYKESRCGGSFEELCQIQKAIMEDCHKKSDLFKH